MNIIEKIDIRPDWYMFMIDNKIKNNKIEKYLKLSYEYERKAAELITMSFIKKNFVDKESCEVIIKK